MDWDYELAQQMKQRKQSPLGVEGKVVYTDPLTISLFDGEVMAPPAPLAVVESAPGYALENHSLIKAKWETGDRVVCVWVGKTLVVLGRI